MNYIYIIYHTIPYKNISFYVHAKYNLWTTERILVKFSYIIPAEYSYEGEGI